MPYSVYTHYMTYKCVVVAFYQFIILINKCVMSMIISSMLIVCHKKKSVVWVFEIVFYDERVGKFIATLKTHTLTMLYEIFNLFVVDKVINNFNQMDLLRFRTIEQFFLSLIIFFNNKNRPFITLRNSKY